MKRPPNIFVTLSVAAAVFAAVVAVKYAVTHDRPWLTDESAAFAQAHAQNKAVLIDFTESWSVPSAETSRALDDLTSMIDERYVRLRVDISDGNDELRARYKIATSPAVVLVTTDGRVLHRITRMLDADELRVVIR